MDNFFSNVRSCNTCRTGKAHALRRPHERVAEQEHDYIRERNQDFQLSQKVADGVQTSDTAVHKILTSL